MKDVQRRQLGSLKKMQAYLRDSPPKDPRIDQFREELDEVIAWVSACESQQKPQRQRQRRVRSAWTDAARQRLRDHHLLPIARAGRMLLKNEPGREEILRVPHKRASNEEFLRYTTALTKWLKKYVKAFVGKKFPKNFLVQAMKAAAALGADVKLSSKALRTRTRATAEIDRELTRGYGLKMTLDAMMRRNLDETGLSSRLWNDAMRVGPRLGRPLKRKNKRPGEAPPEVS